MRRLAATTPATPAGPATPASSRTRHVRGRRGFSAAAVGALTAGLVVTAAPAMAAPSVDQELPFRCGEVWQGTTRASHSPSAWSVDFNRSNDFRMPVVASAAGHVYRVNDVGNTSYGKYVFIDHGNGESTVYAHLDAFLVQQGAYVDQGQVIGLLGNSGGSYGAHLHYEQRYGSSVGQPYFHQTALAYNRAVVSQNCPQTPLTGDWDGDGDSDRAMFARQKKGVFRLKPGRRVQRVVLGNPTDQAVAGDWNGNGTDGVAVRDQRTRVVTMRNPDGGQKAIRFGPRNAHLLAGDWDGNGKDSLGFYRPKWRAFVLKSPGKPRQRVVWGADGSLPVTGDWDGNGVDDVGSFDPLAAEFSLRVVDPATGSPYEVLVPVTLVSKDDGTDAPAVGLGRSFDPSEAEEAPAPDPTVTDPEADPAEPETAEALPVPPVEVPTPGTPTIELPTDDLGSAPLPVVGDWNADGRDDLGVWDPATARWTSWVVNTLERRASTPSSKRFGRVRF